MTTPFVGGRMAGPVGERVGSAWHDANAANYVSMTAVPTLTVPGQKALKDGSFSYQLETLASILYRAGQDDTYTIGDAPPAASARSRTTVSGIIVGRHGVADPWPLASPDGEGGVHARAYWDSYAEVDGQMRARAYARRDYYLYQHLITDSIYGNGSGSQLSFAGTQPINDRDTSADQQALRDIRNQIKAVRKWKRPGLRLIGIGDPAFWYAIAHHLDVVGGGVGSAVPAGLSIADTQARMKRVFPEFDAFFELSALVNAAEEGQTASPNYVSTAGFFWLGLVDARQSLRFDSSMGMGPDGAFAIAQASSPWVKRWEPAGHETELYAERDEFIVYSIRGADFGRCFTGNITT